MANKYKAIIFDADGTLTITNSWNILTEALGASENQHQKIYLARKSGAISLNQARKVLISLWNNTGNANEKFMRQVFKKTKLRQGAKQTVDYLNKKGYLTCLITGSNNLFAQEVAHLIGIQYYYSNATFKFSPNGHLENYEYELNQGFKKLEQLNKFCIKNNIKITKCAVVGDGANDIEMMKAAGLGIAMLTEELDQEIEKYADYKISKLLELKRLL
ncbi:MAG: Phosphoserine phosphatase SerB [Candidatus Curtissbacteria bacterium GW2011_GWA1_40_9]|uniref:phosphoserine phosphatase n=1 Tax=Candidatus Curtissbacteria bacterium GW2011_GWA1_40_9 TaxID=1618408 RepID=A0A0G0TMU1_9BACT|nr:MAG: Phosphoserine phosphatase SerB [Candidatus Curtissbacteria bacterium GW2011_GWA1_40_9]